MADVDAVFAPEPSSTAPATPTFAHEVPAVVDTTAFGGGGGVVNTYFMRAWDTVLTEYVFWESVAAPDFIGTGSGHTPGDLDFFAVLKVERT